jgi:hypothetical protein
VFLGHGGEVVGQQQRAELTHQPRQLLAVLVERRQRGPLLLAVLVPPDQFHVVGGPRGADIDALAREEQAFNREYDRVFGL